MFVKSATYLTLNMMVIPALTLSTDPALTDPKYASTPPSSIWTFLTSSNFNITELLAGIYLGKNGPFFVSLVVQ